MESRKLPTTIPATSFVRPLYWIRVRATAEVSAILSAPRKWIMRLDYFTNSAAAEDRTKQGHDEWIERLIIARK